MTPQKRDELLTRLDERVTVILAEVKKTNGRVTVLEGVKNRMIGAIIATGMVGTLLGALIGYAITYYAR